jgi:hypothetical protein
MFDEIKKVLLEVDRKAGSDFSGTGIVVYTNMNEIPVFPLHRSKFQSSDDGLVTSLIEISKLSNPHHDGFHFISSSLILTHTSQYFSPPIVNNVKINQSKIIGGRYMAALFGSCLKNVLLTGIVTRNNGVVIFKSGAEVFSLEKI